MELANKYFRNRFLYIHIYTKKRNSIYLFVSILSLVTLLMSLYFPLYLNVSNPLNMEKHVRPVFTLELNYKIIPGLVAIGKYDGTHPCVTAATTADKILIHSPHRRNSKTTPSPGRLIWSESNREIATLNINQTISALTTGALLLPDDDKDILIIGTETHILAYHVHDNRDVFYKECQDGVKAICMGIFRSTGKNPIIMVGGNSSIHGYDHTGNEIFWTAVGDVVTALILIDYNKDGENEMIVSSEDFKIRVFKGDQILTEQNETEVVTCLVVLPENRFAYAVSNGTLGVYEQDIRLWRVKSKHFAIAIEHYDLLGQNTPQLITGWSNGKIDCRSIKTGEVLFKDSMSANVAGVVEGDYRSIGKTDIICISSDGEVRGYTTTKSLTSNSGLEQDTIRELLTRKQALLMELKQYENNTRYNENVMNQTESYENDGVIPANTRLQIGITTSEESTFKNHIEIFVSTNNTTIIKAVIIFAEGIFKGETHVVHPPQSRLSSDLLIPLYLPKDNPVDIHVKALVGYPNSVQFHVFEITRQLPRFSMYRPLITNIVTAIPESFVEFQISDRLQRICIWVNQSFLLNNDIEYDNEPQLKLNFFCLRNGQCLNLSFESCGKTRIYTDDLTLASDLVQSIAGFLKIDNLDSMAYFSKEEDNLKKLMETLNEIQDVRIRLGTDVADRLGQIRNLVIRAEDSRVNDIKEIPRFYNELGILNKELINSYNIRLQNYNEGMETMKRINSIIQKASRLRVGQSSANMLNDCRLAIKNNNTDGLLKIIRTGGM